MKKLLALAVAALTIHSNSRADAVFEWQSAANETPRAISMKMVFSDDAVAAGTYRYDYAAWAHFDDYTPPGLLEISFYAQGATHMRYTPSSLTRWYGAVNLDLTFDPLGYATGAIYFNDSNSDVRMRSSGSLFNITDMHSDWSMSGDGINCTGRPGCLWSNGYIMRSINAMPDGTSAVDVPEPTDISLACLGLFLILYRQRRSE